MSELIKVDSWSWENSQRLIEGEKRAVRLMRTWGDKEAPPVAFTVSPDLGFRLSIHPDGDPAEESLRRLLAWFVRHSSKRFMSFVREETGKISWWNNDYHNGSVIAGNEEFEDAEGKFTMLILIEKFPIGPNCKIVEETRTVIVKKVVCSEAVSS